MFYHITVLLVCDHGSTCLQTVSPLWEPPSTFGVSVHTVIALALWMIFSRVIFRGGYSSPEKYHRKGKEAYVVF